MSEQPSSNRQSTRRLTSLCTKSAQNVLNRAHHRSNHRSSSFSTSFTSTRFPKAEPRANIPTPPKTEAVRSETTVFDQPKPNHNIPRVLIVGGGASGLALATKLGRKLGKRNEAEILLVSSTLTHIWKPLLHECAAGSLNTYEDELNYFGHGAANGFQFHLGSLSKIDPTNKRVFLSPMYRHPNTAQQLLQGQLKQVDDEEVISPERFIDFDYLVLAIGSKGNDFNTPGAREHCIFLDSRQQADRFQRELVNCYLKAQGRNIMLHHGHDLSTPLKEDISVVAVGGGLTGVELVSELQYVVNSIAKYGLKSINPEDVKINLIEASERILPALEPELSQEVHEKLVSLGIQVHTKTKVVRVEEHAMICEKDGKELILPSTLSAWCAGIKADPELQSPELETNRLNQLIVNSHLQTTKYPNIFAVGDCSSYTPAGSLRPLPASAQVAHQQADFLAKHLPTYLKTHTMSAKDFEYVDKGVLISIAKTAVGKLFGTLTVRSVFAGMLYYSMYRLHQLDIHGPWKTAVWIWRDVITHMNGRPQIKLH